MSEQSLEQPVVSVKLDDPAQKELVAQILEGITDQALSQSVEEAVVDKLQRETDATAIIKRRAEILATARAAAIQATDPADWVLTRDKQGVEIGMVGNPGAAKMQPVLGISVTEVWPRTSDGRPDYHRTEFPGGVFSLRRTFSARCSLTGVQVEGLEAERRSDEQFTGRGVDKNGKITTRDDDKEQALEQDLRSAVAALVVTKAVRVLAGMARVPREELDAAWKASGKSAERCRKGHGYGTSTARGAQTVASDDVKQGAAELWREMLRAAGGDVDMAKRFLKECTGNDKFKGWDDFQRIAEDWQLKGARDKWSRHPMRGNAAESDAK